MLRFSDGEEFDLTGKLHMEKRRVGLYVVGKGFLIPVESREEGQQVMKELLDKGKEEGE